MELRRILVLAEGQLGDLLLLTPALRALKNGYPRSRLTVIVFQRRLAQPPGTPAVLKAADGSGTAAVLTTHPGVDEVIEIDRSLLRSLKGRRRVSAELTIAHRVRAGRFDAVLCTFPEDRFSMLAWLAGARMRVGERYGGLGFLLNVRTKEERAALGVREYYCRLAEAMGGKRSSTATEFAIPEDADRRAAECLQEAGVAGGVWVAVHPGASGDYKIWPPERYAELIGRLKDRGVAAALVGGDADARILADIVKSCSSSPAVIRTGNDLGLLAACLGRSALCVSNDSGPRHLAVAVGTPSLALFRRFHEREWGVYPPSPVCVTMTGAGTCSLCQPGSCADRIPEGEIYGAECLRQLDVETVLAGALKMLTAVSAGTRRTSSGGKGRSARA